MQTTCPHCQHTWTPAAKPAKAKIVTLPDHPGPDASTKAIYAYYKAVNPYRSVEAFIERCGYADLEVEATALRERAYAGLPKAEILRELSALQDERRQRSAGWMPGIPFAASDNGWAWATFANSWNRDWKAEAAERDAAAVTAAIDAINAEYDTDDDQPEAA